MSRTVYVIGVGQTIVGEHWEYSLRELAWHAAEHALLQAGLRQPDALYVGNMLAGALSGQEHLGALLADFFGLRHCESVSVEAAQASGGAAFRQAYLAIKSGFVDTALVVGVEKMTDLVGSEVASAVGASLDSDWETNSGASLTSTAALLTQLYLHAHQLEPRDLAHFACQAHANAQNNPYAMFRNLINADQVARAPLLATPLTVFDCAPDGDGAAAVVLAAGDVLPTLASKHPLALARVAASSLATAPLALHDRPQLLNFAAAQSSAMQAYRQAGIGTSEIDVFELHDAYSVFAALSLEAAGFAMPGQGWQQPFNQSPVICTAGGSKARGNPAGAVGVYQILEVVQQLTGHAPTPHPNVQWGMAQCLGGSGATAVTHILTRP